MTRSFVKFAAVLMAGTMLAGVAEARTLKWARSGDSLTLDPHAQNEGPTSTLAHQIYEPLVTRKVDGGLEPTLATSWRILPDDPTVWEFKLRQGVKFHNGNPFNADDVVFSVERVMSPTSDFKGLWASVESVKKVDDYTVHIKTKGPNPILIQNMTNTFMMDKEWTTANKAEKVQDFKNKEENFAVRNANGTGAFQLVSREPDVRTVLRRNDAYWGKGKVPLEVSEIVYSPVKADATRIAAMLSGEVDFVQDVPVQDIQRLKSQSGVKVNEGPENRTIFLGMDVGSAELRSSDQKGKNPFADKRVRQAMSMAINRDAIQRVVMRGQSRPTGTIAPPFIDGFTPEMGKPPAYDVAKAKAMLAAAGYPNGFSVTLNCPNDRYLNDEGICQAVVGMLGQIGIKINLVAQSKSIHFPLIQKNPPETQFYLLGWGVPPFDSDYIFTFLYHTREGARGGWNAIGLSDKALDAKIQSLASETNLAKRKATVADIWAKLQDETYYIPLHDQLLAYAMKPEINIPVHPDNTVWIKYVSFKK
ncbi:MAG: ABC transporter substrate-binding protein [Alphaproteobacteria bacterium]|nr:ABC transporter substrate-binding protein [Alphaproteobacteria bacterium]